MSDPLTIDEARQNLDRALIDFIVAYDGLDPGEMLGDWAFIAQLPSSEDSDRTAYFTGYHAHHVPTHIARGLFQVALDRASDDDEET